MGWNCATLNGCQGGVLVISKIEKCLKANQLENTFRWEGKSA